MRFIDAVLAIAHRDGFTLCDDPDEQEGLHPSICVYNDSVFVGKLRWPSGDGRPASVDPEVSAVLEASDD